MDILAVARLDGHHVLAWPVIGLVAGVLASLVVRDSGLRFVRDIIVGLIGAVIGGLVRHAFTGAHTSVRIWKEIVGAVILLVVVRLFTHSSGRTARR